MLSDEASSFLSSSHDPDADRREIALDRLVLAATVGIALLLLAAGHWARLADPFTFEWDFRSQTWIGELANVSPLDKDSAVPRSLQAVSLGPIRTFINARGPLYSLLMHLLVQVVDPVTAGKLLAIPLTVVAAAYSFKILLTRLDRWRAALGASGMITILLVSSASLSITPGFRRSFFIPLLLVLIYCLLRKRFWSGALVIIVSGLIYPPSLAIMVGISGLGWLETVASDTRTFARVGRAILPAIAGVAAALLLLLTTSSGVAPQSSWLGVDASPDLAALTGLSQKFEAFVWYPLVGAGGLVEQGRDLAIILVLGLLALGAWAVARGQRLIYPAMLTQVLISGAIGFVAAWGFILLTSRAWLYFPSRHSQSSIIVFLLLFLGFNVVNASRTWARRLANLDWAGEMAVVLVGSVLVVVSFLRRDTDSTVAEGAGLLPFIALAALVILIGLLVLRRITRKSKSRTATDPGIRTSTRQTVIVASMLLVLATVLVRLVPTPFYSPSDSERELLAFLETLEERQGILVEPCTLASVPITTGHRTLFDCEKPLRRDLFTEAVRHYYGSNPVALASFCSDNGLGYIVFNKSVANDGYVDNVLERYPPDLLPDNHELLDGAAAATMAKDDPLLAGSQYIVARCAASGRWNTEG